MRDSIEDRFADIIAALSSQPGVMLPSAAGAAKDHRFGAGALRVDGKIFAMVTRGTLVVKLPRTRVASLIASGCGNPFDAGRGRPMLEWLAVDPSCKLDWLTLAREALIFVRSVRPKP